MKFLIDECLSLELVRIARERGFGESMHVNHLNLCGEDDGTVLACAVDRGYVLVTNNSRDFLRRVERVEIHAGLVCLDMPNEQRASRSSSGFSSAPSTRSAAPSRLTTSW